MKKGENTSRSILSGKRKILFSTILILIPFVFLFLVEIILRIFNYGDTYRLFVDFTEKDFSEYRFINPDIGKKYFRKLDYNRPAADMFLKEKPENGFRIFVMGSSTVLGFPYNQNLMFTRILEERLQDCYPDEKVEVINTSITAINSFTLLDFTDDILKEKPDAILIYAGHNEFYGALGIGSVEKPFSNRILTRLHLELLSLRFYQLLRNIINQVGELATDNKPGQGARGTLMKVIVKNKEIPYGSAVYNTAMDRYRKNMEAILKKAERREVPVFISTLVSNVKDLSPFCSVSAEDYQPASEVYNSALEMEQEHNFPDAKKAYYEAKDLDCIRFRASEDINGIIQELALEYNAYLVPMKDIFEKSSPNELIGHNLITEHLHPNISGYFLMADAFFNKLAESKLPGEQLNLVYFKNSSYYRKNWGYTDLDSLTGEHLVRILSNYWPFKSMEATPKEYLQSYRPKSLVDSFAFKVATSPSLKIDEAHIKLAEYYKAKGDYYKAFREYYANLKYDPFQVRDFNDAVQCLTKTNDLALANKLVNRSLELKETLYAYLIKSELLLLQDSYDEATTVLESALKYDNSLDARLKILTKLYKIQYYQGDCIKCQKLLQEIRKINPAFEIQLPEKKPSYVDFIPIQVESKIKDALALNASGNTDASLEKLLQTLEVKETSIANRTIGQLLMKSHDKNALLYYLKAYPDYKKDLDFLFELGSLYHAYNDAENAENTLKEMRNIDRDSRQATMLENELSATD